MKYFSEKEKKLEIALHKLKKLNLIDEDSQKNLEFLSDQKNQLEIEKKELENKHEYLIKEHQKLNKRSLINLLISLFILFLFFIHRQHSLSY